MSVRRLEEMSSPALDALDRTRTVIVLTVSPLEEHGPHLPLGVDAIAARHFAESIAAQLVAARPVMARSVTTVTVVPSPSSTNVAVIVALALPWPRVSRPSARMTAR